MVDLSNAVFNGYKIKWYDAINSERGVTQSAFYVNLYRAVIGPSG